MSDGAFLHLRQTATPNGRPQPGGNLLYPKSDGKWYTKDFSGTETLVGPIDTSTFATLAGVQTLTNKTLALGSNTISGTTAQFNAALTDNDFATLAGVETLTNKSLTSPTITGIGQEFYAEKSADQSVTSSITLVNDTHLSVAIPGAGTYLLDLWLYGVSAANAAGHIRYGFSFASGTLLYGINVPIFGLASGTSGSGDWGSALPATSGVATGVGGLSTNPTQHLIHGRYVATGAVTLQFMWAQGSSNANASTLKAGSHMRVKRVL